MATRPGPRPRSLTLHVWMFHEQQEAISQGCADRLSARKEEVQGGQHQVLQVELRVGVVLLLQGEGFRPGPLPSALRALPGSLHLGAPLLGPD